MRETRITQTRLFETIGLRQNAISQRLTRLPRLLDFTLSVLDLLGYDVHQIFCPRNTLAYIM